MTQVSNNGIITTYEYDLNGNLIGDSNGKVYGYDVENRLVYADIDGSETEYTITAEGLRSGKWGGENPANYVTDEDGKVIKENEEEIIMGHQALAKKVGDAYYYYIYNAHGDVIMMVDESGNIKNTYEYDAWGKITEETETVPNSIKYAGEYYDAETGFVYLRNRMYDPATRRFTSEDPARDQLNWYAYCGNNPVMMVDPSGLGYSNPRIQNILEVIYNTFEVNPINTYKANSIANWARDMGVQRAELLWFYDKYGTLVTWDNEADAYRHFLWNARMTREIGYTEAAKIATYHEIVSWDSQKVNGGKVYFVSMASLMDMANNEMGRLYAAMYPELTYTKLFSIAAFRDGAIIMEIGFTKDYYGLSDWQIMTDANGNQYVNMYVSDNGEMQFLTYEEYKQKLGG